MDLIIVTHAHTLTLHNVIANKDIGQIPRDIKAEKPSKIYKNKVFD